MGLYEDALAQTVAVRSRTKQRTRQSVNNLGSFIDIMETARQTAPSPIPQQSSPSRGFSGSTRNLMEGRGPSSGGTPKLKTWKWNGRLITTAANAEKNFRGLLNELHSMGYKIDSVGGYANRNARGSNRKSEHAYGRALDINPGRNPMTGKLITDMPKNITQIAARHGLIWGGTWKSVKDPMHFSTTGW